MDKEVVWSLEASKDLESLADYISRDSIFNAEAFVQEILLASRSLSFMANRGRIAPELDVPHIRELIVNEYRLLYHIEESRIVILGCIHGKRRFRFPPHHHRYFLCRQREARCFQVGLLPRQALGRIHPCREFSARSASRHNQPG